MKNRFSLFLFFLFISTQALVAQDTLHTKIKRERYNLKQFTKETGKFVTLPGRWKTEDWFKVGFLGAGTYLFMQGDQPLRNQVLKTNRQYYYSVPIVGGRLWGEWYTSATIVAGAEVYRLLKKNEATATKKTGLELFQAALYSEAITSVLKVSVGRARPYVDTGSFVFHPFTVKADYNSYPSGHTTLAFALSTVLARNTDHLGLKILAYTPAFFTIASRIYQDMHWDSDILTGAAIGYFTATWVVNLHEIKTKTPPPDKFNPLPSAPNEKTTPPAPSHPIKTSHFGFQVGFNASKLITHDVFSMADRGGLNAGAFGKIAITPSFSFQPEVAYSMKGGSLTYSNEYLKGSVLCKLNYIDFPLLAVLNLTKNTNVQAGVYLSPLIIGKSVNVNPDTASFDFARNITKANFNTLDYGLLFGLGIDLKKINYGIRYSYGLNPVGKEYNFSGIVRRFPDGVNSMVYAYISYNLF